MTDCTESAGARGASIEFVAGTIQVFAAAIRMENIEFGGIDMDKIVLNERLNGDGVLHLELPLGISEAGRGVRVTVEPDEPRAMTPEEWRAWVLAMAGTWQGDFERPEQGELEVREPLS